MARLEDLARGALVKGILPEEAITVVDVQWHGTTVIELTYKDASGRLGHELLFPDREPALEPLPHQITAVYQEMLPRLAVTLPPRRRPGGRKGDHGRPPHQGPEVQDPLLREGVDECPPPPL